MPGTDGGAGRRAVGRETVCGVSADQAVDLVTQAPGGVRQTLDERALGVNVANDERFAPATLSATSRG